MNIQNCKPNQAYGVYMKSVAKKYDIPTAIILSELIGANYYKAEADGWFSFSSQNMKNETTFSPYIQNKCYDKLEVDGIIETKFKGLPATKFFKIKDVSL